MKKKKYFANSGETRIQGHSTSGDVFQVLSTYGTKLFYILSTSAAAFNYDTYINRKAIMYDEVQFYSTVQFQANTWIKDSSGYNKLLFGSTGENTIKTNNSSIHTTFTISDSSTIARLYSDGYLSIQGYLTENVNWSDKKFKKNIKKVDSNNLLDLVNKIDVVNYNLKSDNNDNFMGFIADDVADIFPDIVKDTNLPFNFKKEDVIPCSISNNILTVYDCCLNTGDIVIIDDNTEITIEDVINNNTYKIDCSRDISNTNIKDIKYDSVKIIQYNRLIPVLVSNIQLLTQRIEILETEIKNKQDK